MPSFSLNCPRCQKGVVVDVVATDEFKPDPDDNSGTDRMLARCIECAYPFLLEREFAQVDTDTVIWDDVRVLFPSSPKLGASVPKIIADSYTEAEGCFRIQAYTASAIMCRRTLEGICTHHGLTDGNLKAKLKKLREMSVIENRLYEWADSLRDAGNDAAHEVDITFSKEDARDVLEFTRALVEYIFTFADAFVQFKERREKRVAKQSSESDDI